MAGVTLLPEDRQDVFFVVGSGQDLSAGDNCGRSKENARHQLHSLFTLTRAARAIAEKKRLKPQIVLRFVVGRNNVLPLPLS
jgi:hypothetical protein